MSRLLAKSRFAGAGLALATVRVASLSQNSGCDGAQQPLVVLISIDTLRADHLGLYGAMRPTSPVLDALALEGATFDDASATSPWTLPAHASLLTGLRPRVHGAVSKDHKLAERIDTLASLLFASGYDSAAVVNSTYLRRDTFGLTRGFLRIDYVEEDPSRAAPQRSVTDAALRFLDDMRGQPAFLFVHYYDVHADYASLPEYESEFVTPYDGIADGTSGQLFLANLHPGYVDRCAKAFSDECRISDDVVIDATTARIRFDAEDARHLEELYDAGVRQMDAEIGRFFEGLRERGVYARALIIVTSDHGEEFLDHGQLEHSRSQYQEVIRVPLIVRGPGVPAGFRSSASVSLIDVAPTILRYAGAAIPTALRGLDLALLWSGGDPALFEKRLLFGEAPGFRGPMNANRSIHSVRRGRYKLHFLRSGAIELFDLQRDPRERVDIAAREPEVVARLLTRFKRVRQPGEPQAGGKPALSPEDEDRLRELGYGP